MDPIEPRIRAVQTQLLLRAIGRLPAADREAVHALAGPDALAEANAVLPVAWQPMSLHMQLSDAARDVIGPERNVALWNEVMTACFDRPLLRSFITLFGMSPLSLLRKADRIYLQITRDLGMLRFDPDRSQSGGSITLRGFPAHRYRFICYVEGLMGCIQASFPVASAAGSVVVADCDDARGDVRYSVRWRALAPARVGA